MRVLGGAMGGAMGGGGVMGMMGGASLHGLDNPAMMAAASAAHSAGLTPEALTLYQQLVALQGGGAMGGGAMGGGAMGGGAMGGARPSVDLTMMAPIDPSAMPMAPTLGADASAIGQMAPSMPTPAVSASPAQPTPPLMPAPPAGAVPAVNSSV